VLPVRRNVAHVSCYLCAASNKASKQTIHGLKYHLEKFHKELHAQYTEKVDARHTEAQVSE